MEYEVHVGHWEDWNDHSVFPIATLERARKIARRVAAKTGEACIWVQDDHGIRFVECWS